MKITPFSFLSTDFFSSDSESSFLLGLASPRSIGTSEFVGGELSRCNSYEAVKNRIVPEFGNFMILSILQRGMSSTVCLCEWVLEEERVLLLPPYITFVNKKFFNDLVQISNNFNVKRTDEMNQYNIESVVLTESESSINMNHKKHHKIVLKLKHKGEYYKRVEIEQMRDELSIHKELWHSNILKLLISGEDANDVWAFFEYSLFGDLHSYVGFRTMGEKETQFLVCQILFALYYLHSRGIIHCDLKPQNILLFPLDSICSELKASFLSESTQMYPLQVQLNEEKLQDNLKYSNINSEESVNRIGPDIYKHGIKLCDFGLSVRCPYNTFYPSRGIKGSYGYVAPEVFKEYDFNHKIDMWALGILIFILIGGYRPFYPTSNFQERVEFHERYWSNISEEAKDFIQSLLQIDPEKRLSIIEALQHPWIKSYFIIA